VHLESVWEHRSMHRPCRTCTVPFRKFRTGANDKLHKLQPVLTTSYTSYNRSQQQVTQVTNGIQVPGIIEIGGNMGGRRAFKRREHSRTALEPVSGSQRLTVVLHEPAHTNQLGDVVEPFVDAS